jgi:hypothetical protein
MVSITDNKIRLGILIVNGHESALAAQTLLILQLMAGANPRIDVIQSLVIQSLRCPVDSQHLHKLADLAKMIDRFASWFVVTAEDVHIKHIFPWITATRA